MSNIITTVRCGFNPSRPKMTRADGCVLVDVKIGRTLGTAWMHPCTGDVDTGELCGGYHFLAKSVEETFSESLIEEIGRFRCDADMRAVFDGIQIATRHMGFDVAIVELPDPSKATTEPVWN